LIEHKVHKVVAAPERAEPEIPDIVKCQGSCSWETAW